MPASSKASSGCSQSSLLPLLPGFLLPSGCHGGCCQCQLLASSVATNLGSLRGMRACTVRAWQTFQSTVHKCTPVPGHAADQHRHSSKYYNVAQLQNARQGNAGSNKRTVSGGQGKTQQSGCLRQKCRGNIMEMAISQDT